MQRKFIASLVLLCLLADLALPGSLYAQNSPFSYLPSPGSRLGVSEAFELPCANGVEFDPHDPFKFSFLIKRGRDTIDETSLRREGERLAKYFFAALALPAQDLWVNLSPYESDRIVPDALSQTDLGRDLLSEDYILKQLAASLTYPDTEAGKKYWNALNQPVAASRGRSNASDEAIASNINKQAVGHALPAVAVPACPVPAGVTRSFQKVWIVPDKMLIYEDGNRATIGEATLKVLCEEDYAAMQANGVGVGSKPTRDNGQITNLPLPQSTNLAFKQHILPLIEKEVNHGRQFASLRQLYRTVILAGWFRKKLRKTIYDRVYFEQKKIKGAVCDEPGMREKIYRQYLAAFTKGAYDCVKSERVGANGRSPLHKTIRRRYFSGGADISAAAQDDVPTATGRGPDTAARVDYATVWTGPRKRLSSSILALGENIEAVLPRLLIGARPTRWILDPAGLAEMAHGNKGALTAVGIFASNGDTQFWRIHYLFNTKNDLLLWLRTAFGAYQGGVRFNLANGSYTLLTGPENKGKNDFLSQLGGLLNRLIISEMPAVGGETITLLDTRGLTAILREQRGSSQGCSVGVNVGYNGSGYRNWRVNVRFEDANTLAVDVRDDQRRLRVALELAIDYDSENIFTVKRAEYPAVAALPPKPQATSTFPLAYTLRQSLAGAVKAELDNKVKNNATAAMVCSDLSRLTAETPVTTLVMVRGVSESRPGRLTLSVVDDAIVAQLRYRGEETGEPVWRQPFALDGSVIPVAPVESSDTETSVVETTAALPEVTHQDAVVTPPEQPVASAPSPHNGPDRIRIATAVAAVMERVLDFRGNDAGLLTGYLAQMAGARSVESGEQAVRVLMRYSDSERQVRERLEQILRRSGIPGKVDWKTILGPASDYFSQDASLGRIERVVGKPLVPLTPDEKRAQKKKNKGKRPSYGNMDDGADRVKLDHDIEACMRRAAVSIDLPPETRLTEAQSDEALIKGLDNRGPVDGDFLRRLRAAVKDRYGLQDVDIHFLYGDERLWYSADGLRGAVAHTSVDNAQMYILWRYLAMEGVAQVSDILDEVAAYERDYFGDVEPHGQNWTRLMRAAYLDHRPAVQTFSAQISGDVASGGVALANALDGAAVASRGSDTADARIDYETAWVHPRQGRLRLASERGDAIKEVLPRLLPGDRPARWVLDPAGLVPLAFSRGGEVTAVGIFAGNFDTQFWRVNYLFTLNRELLFWMRTAFGDYQGGARFDLASGGHTLFTKSARIKRDGFLYQLGLLLDRIVVVEIPLVDGETINFFDIKGLIAALSGQRSGRQGCSVGVQVGYAKGSYHRWRVNARFEEANILAVDIYDDHRRLRAALKLAIDYNSKNKFTVKRADYPPATVARNDDGGVELADASSGERVQSRGKGVALNLPQALSEDVTGVEVTITGISIK